MAETSKTFPPPPAGDAPGQAGWAPAAAVFAFVLLAHALLAVLGGSPAVQGGLADGDSYLRLVRVQQLLAGGGWFDSTIAQANAPYGFAIHWTRPLDLLLIALAAPLAPFLGMAQALHLAGILLSPLLHALSALALIWAVSPLLGRWGGCLAAFLTVAQPGVMKPAAAGAADHHLLLVMLAILLVGCLIRSFTAPTPQHGAATGAGLLAALGVWVGTEIFIVLGLGLLVAGVAWLADEAQARRRLHRVALAFALGLALALLIERGPGGLAAVQYERLSILHLTLAGLFLMCTSALGAWQKAAGRRDGPAGRVIGAAICSIAGLAIMVWLFPGFPQGPTSGMEPAMLLVLDRVEEYKPITDPADMLGFLGTILFALPMLAWRLRRDWAGPRRWAWLLIAVCTAVFSLLALDWLRWALYAGIFLTIPLADLILRLDHALRAWKAGPGRVLTMVGGMAFIALGPLLLAGVLLGGRGGGGGGGRITANNCAIPPLARHLGAFAGRTVLAPTNLGPEIIYRTGLKVIGTLHHSNQRGILEGIAILRAADEGKARAMLRRRGIDLILLCPGYDGNLYAAGGDDAGLFYRRLLAGKLPAWVRESRLPAELGGRYRLFEIAPF